jgi:hypothetical protein
MTEIQHHDVGKIVCPYCASIFDCAMNVGPEPGAPEDSNINVCINCMRISLYHRDSPGGLRIPTDAEYVEASADPDVKKAIWAIRRTNYHIKRRSN